MRVRACTLCWAAMAAAAGSVAVAADARAAFGDRPLRRGMHGHDVRVLQSWLTKLGEPTVVDGHFGPRTARHVRAYERREGLHVDGRVSRVQARGIRRRIERTPVRTGARRTGRPGTGRAHRRRPGGSAAGGRGRDRRRQPHRHDAVSLRRRSSAQFEDSAYDCSGAVSYALHGAGLLDRPQDSSELMRFGEPGPGSWITVYANPGHAYVVIAGLRFDTSGRGESGPRWRPEPRSGRRLHGPPSGRPVTDQPLAAGTSSRSLLRMRWTQWRTSRTSSRSVAATSGSEEPSSSIPTSA